jgi:hypothetical protein
VCVCVCVAVQIVDVVNEIDALKQRWEKECVPLAVVAWLSQTVADAEVR